MDEAAQAPGTFSRLSTQGRMAVEIEIGLLPDVALSVLAFKLACSQLFKTPAWMLKLMAAVGRRSSVLEQKRCEQGGGSAER